jgi:hypothetical protein
MAAYKSAQKVGAGGRVVMDWENPKLKTAVAALVSVGESTAKHLIGQYPEKIADIAFFYEEKLATAKILMSNAKTQQDAAGYVGALAEFKCHNSSRSNRFATSCPAQLLFYSCLYAQRKARCQRRCLSAIRK